MILKGDNIGYLELKDFDEKGNLLIETKLDVIIMFQASWLEDNIILEFQKYADENVGKVFCTTIQIDEPRQKDIWEKFKTGFGSFESITSIPVYLTIKDKKIQHVNLKEKFTRYFAPNPIKTASNHEIFNTSNFKKKFGDYIPIFRSDDSTLKLYVPGDCGNDKQGINFNNNKKQCKGPGDLTPNDDMYINYISIYSTFYNQPLITMFGWDTPIGGTPPVRGGGDFEGCCYSYEFNKDWHEDVYKTPDLTKLKQFGLYNRGHSVANSDMDNFLCRNGREGAAVGKKCISSVTAGLSTFTHCNVNPQNAYMNSEASIYNLIEHAGQDCMKIVDGKSPDSYDTIIMYSGPIFRTAEKDYTRYSCLAKNGPCPITADRNANLDNRDCYRECNYGEQQKVKGVAQPNIAGGIPIPTKFFKIFVNINKKSIYYIVINQRTPENIVENASVDDDFPYNNVLEYLNSQNIRILDFRSEGFTINKWYTVRDAAAAGAPKIIEPPPKRCPW